MLLWIWNPQSDIGAECSPDDGWHIALVTLESHIDSLPGMGIVAQHAIGRRTRFTTVHCNEHPRPISLMITMTILHGGLNLLGEKLSHTIVCYSLDSIMI